MNAKAAVRRKSAKKPPAKRGKPPVPMYCQCLADPEGSPACRMPDMFVQPTAAQKLIEEFTLSSNPDGDACLSISPSLLRSRTTYTVTGGTPALGTYVAHPDNTETAAAFEYGRAITYQVSVTYIGARQTAAGRIATIIDNNPAYVVGQPLASVFDDGTSRAAIDGAVVRVRPVALPTFDLVAAASFGVPGLAYVYIVAQGLPISTVCFSVRITRHIEFLPRKISMWRGSAAIEPHHPVAMSQAANMAPVGVTGALAEAQNMTDAALATARAAWDYVGPTVTAWGAEVARDSLLALMAA